MTKITPLILLVALAAGLWSCSETVSPGQALLNSNKITFQANQSSYAQGDTVTAILKNKSADTIVCGNLFRVEQKKDGVWTFIDIDAYFTLEAIGLTTGDQKEYHLVIADSSNYYPNHPLPQGQYRITTGISTKQNEDLSVKTSPFEVSGAGE